PRTAVPFVTPAVRLPPPAAAVLDPNPLATDVGPIPAIDRRRREEEGMLLAVISNAIANDEAGIADRFRHREDFEFSQRKIAERVEIVHLAAHPKEGVLGAVSRGR